MVEIDRSELLKIPEVVEEVKRHLWIESEKTGYDIGFDRAADDWIGKYAQAWLNHYKPNYRLKTKEVPAKSATPLVNNAKQSSPIKKRSAKSYTN
ncbi:MAG TPA: hypothetical protein DD723_07335 [Candidatus Omnitrophica bacterium]|nr:MAG: hypothetical protein A2Z81_09245 [Omnitrophica WOR_2 bacterium GWA2_45_18]HBR15338.1 hypothetical protein [Candidatus Omnitrophota bacterium]